jgi:hypothetical protein
MLTFKKDAYLKKGGQNLRQLLDEVVNETRLDRLATDANHNYDLANRRSADAPRKVRITISVEEVKD